jgi:hypothetical protein
MATQMLFQDYLEVRVNSSSHKLPPAFVTLFSHYQIDMRVRKGLQNYMCYSNSLLYAKTGGVGKVSSMAISLFSIVLFIIGPSIANYLPRCMAGTMVLHIGVDLVLEGVFDCKLTNSLFHNGSEPNR